MSLTPMTTESRNAAIESAIAFLAEHHKVLKCSPMGSAHVVYSAGETGTWYSLSASDLADLGQAADMAAYYSEWCSSHGDEVSFDRNEFTLERDINEATDPIQAYVAICHQITGFGADLYEDGEWVNWDEGNGLSKKLPEAADAIRDAAEEMLSSSPLTVRIQTFNPWTKARVTVVLPIGEATRIVNYWREEIAAALGERDLDGIEVPDALARMEAEAPETLAKILAS